MTGLQRSDAEALDANDPLGPLRTSFHIPRRSDGTEATYLCGHSLGLAPKRALQIVNEELNVWARQGVDGHFDAERPWVSYHEHATRGLGLLTGALPIEVVAMNSLTVNLHLLLSSFYRPHGARRKILMESYAFSSDRYAIESQLKLHHLEPNDALVLASPRQGEDVLRTDDLCSLIEATGDSLATVLLPGVQYLTGQYLDMPAITRSAHLVGSTVGFDLAHAIGNVPLRLHDWDVDFAVWCSYKYLNSGPGAIGGAFVHERHAQSDLPRLAGWWGHDKSSRFAMPATFVPLPGAEGWQLSNPPILATAPLLASLAVFEEAGFDRLREKSKRLTAYLEMLLSHKAGASLTILTPTDPSARGCQLSIRLKKSASDARAIHAELADLGFICDWREPDVIRVAPVPLYNTFVEVWEFADALSSLAKTAATKTPSPVTTGEAPLALLRSGHSHIHVQQVRGGGSVVPMDSSTPNPGRSIVICGAGLAGSLLAILLAQRGYHVRLYERLADLRREAIPAGRSINLALAARGIRALELAGVMSDVQPLLIEMPGRMVHDAEGRSTFLRYGQDASEVIYSVSRPGLNRILLDAAERAGVEIFFRHAVTGVDFNERCVRLRSTDTDREITVPLQHVIAADGAGSVLRHALVDRFEIAHSENLLAHGYKELTIPPSAHGQFQLEQHALHIWPRGGFMLIALPNTDGSFTATLFCPHEGPDSFASLASPASVRTFFERHFADALELMPNIDAEFVQRPVGIMGTVRAERWSVGSDLLLIGDAAHAITPFHGQGMNCAFEDCAQLASLLASESDLANVFSRFEQLRRPNTNAIAQMAIENYLEMRDTVRDPKFQLQKALSLELERRFADRFIPRYSMVMFHARIPYAVAFERGRVQSEILSALTTDAHSLDQIDWELAKALIESKLEPILA